MTEEIAKREAKLGTSRLPETVRSYSLWLPNFNTQAAELALHVSEHLEDGEALKGLAHGLIRGREQLLALSDRRVLLIPVSDPGQRLSLELKFFEVAYKKSAWTGEAVTISKDEWKVEIKQYGPKPEAGRIFLRLATNIEPPPAMYEALPEGFDLEPPGPPLAILGPLVLYEDRLINAEVRHLPFDGEIVATADQAGNIAAVRGRNLAAKGAGTLLLGPVGLFMSGNAKTTVIDQRELYLLVEGPNWAFTQKFVPAGAASVREFAQQINVAARQHVARAGIKISSDSVVDAGVPTSTATLAASLRELASLREDGLLTEDEFAKQKAKLLADFA